MEKRVSIDNVYGELHLGITKKTNFSFTFVVSKYITKHILKYKTEILALL